VIHRGFGKEDPHALLCSLIPALLCAWLPAITTAPSKAAAAFEEMEPH
jgi:hypothetical protein